MLKGRGIAEAKRSTNWVGVTVNSVWPTIAECKRPEPSKAGSRLSVNRWNASVAAVGRVPKRPQKTPLTGGGGGGEHTSTTEVDPSNRMEAKVFMLGVSSDAGTMAFSLAMRLISVLIRVPNCVRSSLGGSLSLCVSAREADAHRQVTR